MPLPPDYLLGQARRQAMGESKDGRSEKDFYKMPGGGLRDPQGAPKREDDETTEPTEELPPEGLGKKSPDQDLDEIPTPRGA
jgi:hypothetical protein